MKAEIVNIMKVADIYAGTVSEPVRWFLHGFRTYSDTVLKEHLLNISDAVEEHNQTPVLSPEATEELAHIGALCAANECGYVRFIS